MKPTGTVTVTDHGRWARAKLKTPTVEGASAEGPSGRGAAKRVYATERAGKQSKLTIFCDATGAGSSLYFRVLSGACDSDMLILRARAEGRRMPGRVVWARTRVWEQRLVRPLQFHLQRAQR